MRIIRKHEIIAGVSEIRTKKGAQILSVGTIGTRDYVWVAEDPAAVTVPMIIKAVRTGDLVPEDGIFIGQMSDRLKNSIWHVFRMFP